MILKQVIAGSFITIFSIGVLAQDHSDEDDNDESEYKYALGLVAFQDQSLYLGGDDEIEVFPYIEARWGRFFFEGTSLGVDLYEDNGLSINASISPEGVGDTDRDGSRRLNDMEDFDTVINGQFEISYEADWGEIGMSLGADISSTHDGYKAELSYSYPFELGRWMIEPSVSAEWVSKEENQYYYGVSTRDVRSDRPFYEPDSGVNYGVGINAIYPFFERHAIIFQAEYTSYSSEITDSPIVDRDNTAEIGVGYIYRF